VEIVKHQINSRSVKTPSRRNPFSGKDDIEQELWHRIKNVQQRREVPSGYGLSPEEDGHGVYEQIEILTVGRRSSKQAKHITLPENVWLPRCVLWIQALEAMIGLQHSHTE
jgi:hypothetical protein